MILDTLASGLFSYDAGTSGSVIVGAGKVVRSIICHASAAATLTITPGGAGQTGVAGAAIPIPTGIPWNLPMLGELGTGTVLTFAGTDSYFVQYVGPR